MLLSQLVLLVALQEIVVTSHPMEKATTLTITLPETDPNCPISPSWREQISGDPVASAGTNYKRGNLKYLAVRGFTISIPGTKAAETCLIRSQEYIVLDGTSDMFCSWEELELIEKASSYASAYNNVMLSLRGFDGAACPS